MEQEGIAQVATGERSEGTPQLGQPARLGEQPQTLAAEDGSRSQARPQGKQRQGAGGGAEGLQDPHEAGPFVGGGSSAQVAHHGQEGLQAHTHPQLALGQQ